MQQIQVFDTEKSFSDTIMKQMTNSTDYEQASYADDYSNPEVKYHESNENHLKIYDNILLNKYYHQIKDSCTKLAMDSKLNVKYKYRPEALSTDHYGTPIIWYVILYVNGCESAAEFHDLDYVLVPDLGVIERCIINEEFIQNKDVL